MKTCSTTLMILMSFIVVGGCTSTNENTRVQPKQLIDLTASKGDASDYWVIDKEAAARKRGHTFPKTLVENSQNGCAEITFAINSEGKLSSYRSKYSYPNKDVAKFAAAELASFQWLPTESNDERNAVLTSLFSVFKVPNVEETKEFKEACLSRINGNAK